jgi:hypothetical protein
MTTHRYYPSEICIECGNKHGKPQHEHAVGMWQGVCGWCGTHGTVCAPRDYRYPPWLGVPPEGWDEK